MSVQEQLNGYMEDILEVYKRPNDKSQPLVCMDAGSKQHTKEVRTPLPAAPGLSERYDSEYERNSVSNLFIFFEPIAGKRYINVTDSCTTKDWAHQIRPLLNVRYPDANRVILVMDNLNTHTPASLYKAFEPAEARRLME